VFTKTKVGRDGTRYLFAYNYTASSVTVEFTLAGPATSVRDYDTGTRCAPATSTTFYGAFQPYQAHVFLIGDSASATPAACATPTATPSATPTPTVTATSIRTPVRTGTPTAASTRTANRNRYQNSDRYADGNSQRNSHISATPTATATPGALSVLPAKLKFGAQKLDTTSRVKTLKVTNQSEAAVSFTGMPVSGDFAETNTCGASLAAQNSCTISITFKPTATGKRSGNLPLHDNASNSPQIVTLSGKGNRR